MPTILLVDDEPAILMALKRMLRAEPYDVLTAGSPEQALELLASVPVHVVISDNRMPGMSGGALLDRVRREYPAAVRILASGDAAARVDGHDLDLAAFFRVLPKPFNPSAFRAVIRLALESAGVAQAPQVTL